jgi:ribonuclease HIII
MDLTCDCPATVMDPFNILIPLRLEEVDPIWIMLRNNRFEFSDRTYTYFTAKKDGLHVTVYEKGPKLLVQGNKAPDFVQDVLEPLVARLDAWSETEAEVATLRGP